jgi:hypothetical protein
MLRLIFHPTFQHSPTIESSAAGETSLSKLLAHMQPVLNDGEYAFCTVKDDFEINQQSIICIFKEREGTTLVLDKRTADSLGLPYNYVASWITLTVHSSLEATGLTAAFSNALAAAGISCNVVAAYYHDHIFVDKRDAGRAMEVLEALAGNG